MTTMACRTKASPESHSSMPSHQLRKPFTGLTLFAGPAETQVPRYGCRIGGPLKVSLMETPASRRSCKYWTPGRLTVDDVEMVLHAQPGDQPADQPADSPNGAPKPENPQPENPDPENPEPEIPARGDFNAPAPFASSGSLRNPFPPIA